MTPTIDKLVVNGLAVDLIEAEAEIDRCHRELTIWREMVSFLLDEVHTLTRDNTRLLARRRP